MIQHCPDERMLEASAFEMRSFDFLSVTPEGSSEFDGILPEQTLNALYRMAPRWHAVASTPSPRNDVASSLLSGTSTKIVQITSKSGLDPIHMKSRCDWTAL